MRRTARRTTGLKPLVDFVLPKPQQPVEFEARDLALSGPSVERGGFNVQQLRKFLDRKQHVASRPTRVNVLPSVAKRWLWSRWRFLHGRARDGFQWSINQERIHGSDPAFVDSPVPVVAPTKLGCHEGFVKVPSREDAEVQRSAPRIDTIQVRFWFMCTPVSWECVGPTVV